MTWYAMHSKKTVGQLPTIPIVSNLLVILLEAGWHKSQRIYGNLIHLQIVNGKIWIQQDGTEVGIANELVDLGISPQQIVLAFKTLERRKITDFAVV